MPQSLEKESERRSPAERVAQAGCEWFATAVERVVECSSFSKLNECTRSRPLFELIHEAIEGGYYTYQPPLQGRCGAKVRVAEQELLLFSTYDYLGLIGHPEIEAAAVDAIHNFGTGPGGVRLLTGTNCKHRELEQRLATFIGAEAAMTVSSGYLANLGVIPAIVGPGDRILLDARSHRSLVDGCRLAGVPFEFFAHNDMSSLEKKLRKSSGQGRTLIIVEGLYSMDGDLCPLPDIVSLKNQFGATLLVDEAHSFGIIGASGRGVHEHFGVPANEIDFWTGSLSKAVPANGGFIASSLENIVYLQHTANPYFFSSALNPPMTAAALAAISVIEADPERIQRSAENSRELRSALIESGFDIGMSVSPIIPAILGSDEDAWRFSRSLLDDGIWATAIVAPAVPRGKARLRLCAMANHTTEDIARLVEAMNRSRRKLSMRAEAP